MKKYALVFAVSYLLLTVVLGAIAEVLKVKGGSGFNIAAMLASSFFAASRFTKEQCRLPTAEELKLYSWLAVSAVWGVSLLLLVVALAFLFSPTEANALLLFAASKIFIGIFVVGGLIISVIYYFAIKWSFSWYAKRACGALPRHYGLISKGG